MGQTKQEHLKNKNKKSNKERIRRKKIHRQQIAEKNLEYKLIREEKNIKKELKAISIKLDQNMRMINVARVVSIKVYKILETIAHKRLDIPYLTDNIRDKFKELFKMSDFETATVIRLQEASFKMLLHMRKMQESHKGDRLEIIAANIKNYGQLLTDTDKLLTFVSGSYQFNHTCGRILVETYKLIQNCDDIRSVTDKGEGISPIISEEERKQLLAVMGTSADKFIPLYEQYDLDELMKYVNQISNNLDYYEELEKANSEEDEELAGNPDEFLKSKETEQSNKVNSSVIIGFDPGNPETKENTDTI